MKDVEALRTTLGQARLSVRRAQNIMKNEPAHRSKAYDECDEACALIDYVLRALKVTSDGEAAPQ